MFGDTPSVIVVLVAFPVMFCSAGSLDSSGVPPDIFCADVIEGVARAAIDSIAKAIIADKNTWFIVRVLGQYNT